MVVLAVGIVQLALLETSNTSATDQLHENFSVSYPVKLDLTWMQDASFLLGDLSGKGQNDEKPLKEIELDGFWMQSTKDAYSIIVKATRHDSGNSCLIHQRHVFQRLMT